MYFIFFCTGKTSWVLNLLRHANELIDSDFDYIYFFYGEPTKTIESIQKEFADKLVTVQGLPSNIEDYIHSSKKGLHIYDDLMFQTSESTELSKLCAYKTQHCNISWIVLFQQLFFGGKERKNIFRCCHYLTLFSHILDRSQVYHLAHRVLPSKQKVFIQIFEKATSKPFGYLFLDGRNTTPPEARFRTDLFEGYQKVFIPE